jgi:ribose transport system substrate-binding protein
MTHRPLIVRRLAALLAAAAVLVLVVAACGGDDEDAASGATTEQTAEPGATTEEESSDGVAGAQELLDEYRAVPEFVDPGPAFDAEEAAGGKHLFIIPASSQIPFVSTIANHIESIGQPIGVRTTIWQNQGQPSQWVQGMNAAMSQNADAIVLLAGNDPAGLQPQIIEAKEQGIPTIVAHLYDDDQESAPNVGGLVNIPYKIAGRLIADQAIVDTDGDANALVVTINQVKSTEPMVEGIREEFDAHCPDCKLTFTDVTIAEVATRIQPNVQAALTADPGINYVIALYDSAEVPFAAAGIQAAGRADSVRISTFNGTPEILKMVEDGDLVSMNVGENLHWIAYAILDQSMRIMGGLDPVENARVPVRVFDDSNIAETGADFTGGFGEEYVSGYEQLWGIG